MTISIAFPTSNLAIKGGRVPYQTVFSAILPTNDINTTARFLLNGIPIGSVKIPLRKVATSDNGEAFLYCLIATVLAEGEHTLRVQNVDISTSRPIIREFVDTQFTFSIDPRLVVTRSSEMIASHLEAADPHGQYLTPEEANILYRSAGMLTDSDIPRTQATDAELGQAVANLKGEIRSQYRLLGEISDTDIAGTIARDNEIDAAITDLKKQVDPFSQYLVPTEANALYRSSSAPITDSEIPGAITRDTELATAILKTLSLFPRSSPNIVDANNAMTTAAAGFCSIEADKVHLNLPGASGMLFQFDGLFGTILQGSQRIQLFIGSGTQATLHIRQQNRGVWGNWKLI